jgi:hypothetical protein
MLLTSLLRSAGVLNAVLDPTARSHTATKASAPRAVTAATAVMVYPAPSTFARQTTLRARTLLGRRFARRVRCVVVCSLFRGVVRMISACT